MSGVSSDVRELQSSKAYEAEEALDLFSYRAACELASLASALSGVEVIVFTAGIGEHSALIRRKICERYAWLGVEIDESANENNQVKISSQNSKVDVYIIPTNEALEIAKATRDSLSGLISY